MGEEVWRIVPGWEAYEVSTHGRVRSVERIVNAGRGRVRHAKGVMLKPAPNRRGYLRVGLYDASTSRNLTRLVHHLVMEAFVGPRPPELVTCHYDGDPTNNHLDNLRYDTARGNYLDTLRHGRVAGTDLTHCNRGHLLIEPNLCVWSLRRGWRSCRACDLARKKAGRVTDESVVKRHADDAYLRLMTTGEEALVTIREYLSEKELGDELLIRLGLPDMPLPGQEMRMMEAS